MPGEPTPIQAIPTWALEDLPNGAEEVNSVAFWLDLHAPIVSATTPTPARNLLWFNPVTRLTQIGDGTAWALIAGPRTLYSGTPSAQTLTSSGTLGVNAATGLATLPYASLISIAWGCMVSQVSGDQTQVSLRLAGTDVQAQRGSSAVWSAGGTHSIPVAAGVAAPLIQTVFTVQTGTGSRSTFADPVYNWLEVVVAPA